VEASYVTRNGSYWILRRVGPEPHLMSGVGRVIRR